MRPQTCCACHRQVTRRNYGGRFRGRYYCKKDWTGAPGSVTAKQNEERKRAQAQAIEHVKRWGKVYRMDGRVLPVTTAAREAYRGCCKATRLDTWQRRALVLLAEITAAHRTCSGGKVWPDLCQHDYERREACPEGCTRWDHKITASTGGSCGAPRLVLDRNIWSLGIFEQAVFKGVYRIAVNPSKHGTRRDYTDMTRTLVHEIIHWLDTYHARQRAPEGYAFEEMHGPDFKAREAWLLARLSGSKIVR